LKLDVLIRVFRENPPTFTALLEWLDEQEQTEQRLCAGADDKDEMLRHQGAARLIPRLKVRLEKLVHPKVA
jgi:hypothetical protein